MRFTQIFAVYTSPNISLLPCTIQVRYTYSVTHKIQLICCFFFFVVVVPFSYVTDREKQAEGDDNHGEQVMIGNCQDISVKQNTLKGKGSRKTFKSNMKNTSSISVKPSFPTKKRVQVPQCPLSETPTRLSKFEGQLSEIAKEDPKRSSTTSKENSALNDKGEPVLLPFFWLREEDNAEKSSQHTDESHFMDLPQLDAPAFSDIKDSDDENPSNLTPTVST